MGALDTLLDTRKMETDENSSGALGAGEHAGGSHQLQSPGGAGEICVWFYEEKQEFNRHEESSFVFWGVGRAQERERRC